MMRSNRKWEVAALEKVAVKAAHFVVIGHFELIDGEPVYRVFDWLEVRAR